MKERIVDSGNGAGGRSRTDDLLITNQLLYRLSYTGLYATAGRKYKLFLRMNQPNSARLNYFSGRKRTMTSTPSRRAPDGSGKPFWESEATRMATLGRERLTWGGQLKPFCSLRALDGA